MINYSTEQALKEDKTTHYYCALLSIFRLLILLFLLRKRELTKTFLLAFAHFGGFFSVTVFLKKIPEDFLGNLYSTILTSTWFLFFHILPAFYGCFHAVLSVLFCFLNLCLSPLFKSFSLSNKSKIKWRSICSSVRRIKNGFGACDMFCI